jgi:hypothetical protein
MRTLAPALAVIGMVIIVALVIFIIHKRNLAGPVKAFLDIAVVVIAATALLQDTFFGVHEIIPDKNDNLHVSPTPQPIPSASQLSPSVPDRSPSSPARDKVRILDARAADGKSAAVRVTADSPPKDGRRYILAARFGSPSRYQMKAEIEPAENEQTFIVDLSNATSGSWRDFAVFSVTSEALAAWKSSQEASLNSMPEGSQLVTDWIPFRLR